MSPMTISEKLGQVTTFIYGMQDKQAASYMKSHGLDKEELNKGYDLLDIAIRGDLDKRPEATSDSAFNLSTLDAWENKWFPIVHASLDANYPTICSEIFLNLAQTSGVKVIISVGTLLERLGKLPEGGEEEKAAFALLEKRGLNERVRQEASGLLERLRELPLTEDEEEPPSEGTEEDDEEPETDAVTKVWRWYLQWATIARAVIPRKSVRIKLGVSSRAKPTDKKKDKGLFSK